MLRRLLLFGSTFLVLVIAALIAGWWFFVRSDAQLATEPPAIPTGLLQSTTTPPSAGGDILTFRIIPEESEAAYFVGEQLASLPLPSTAKGATSVLAGEFHLTADGAALAQGITSQFIVDLSTLESDESRRDARVQDALETSLYPTATFTITAVTGYDASLPEGEEQQLQLTGTLDLHGIQREVTWEVLARREGSVISALATLPFRFEDFGITPPNIAGFVSVEDGGTLQVQLIAQLV
jgi:polyisoprenoid-binding protein YceI